MVAVNHVDDVHITIREGSGLSLARPNRPDSKGKRRSVVNFSGIVKPFLVSTSDFESLLSSRSSPCDTMVCTRLGLPN